MIIKITGRVEKELEWKQGETLLDGLHKADVYVNAACGGMGKCGKCKVWVTAGFMPVTNEDVKLFSEEELLAGWRLACMAVPVEDCTIYIEQNDESSFEVESSYSQQSHGEVSVSSGVREKYFFAIDIGTTTIAVGLVNEQNGQLMDVHTGVNHQRAWGADVISRIQASTQGQAMALCQSVKKDLITAMLALMMKHSVSAMQMTKAVIAGNTTMGHLLMEYDCSKLGQVPFTPVNIDTIRTFVPKLFGNQELNIPVILMPGISTYVGADIVSGLYHCDFANRKAPSLFIDLGTNGEMALGNQDKLLVTSTAAGPAFEGGNISCGMGSVAGAISGVKINGDTVELATIGNKAPIGLCGTGVVEATAELVKAELVDETGLLDDEYFDDGYPLAQTPDGNDIVFTQKDIREIQLAKAAVRAGLETLLVRYGIGYEDLDQVLVAGGFGVKLDMEKAAVIGLLPEELLDKVQAVGNTSLAGAVDYGMEEDADLVCHDLISKAAEVDLSTDAVFKEFYMDGMMFE